MKWYGVNVQLLLNLMHPHKQLLLTLHASTTSAKHILHEELELARGFTTRGGGDKLLTMSMMRAQSTWWRSTRSRARNTFAFAFGSFL